MRYFIFLPAFLFAYCVSAQTNLKDGYVILNSGDTLRGQIQEATWSLNPESVIFQTAGNNREYRVAELKGFGIGNEVTYVRFHFTYEQTATELEFADETFEGPSVTTDAWLRTLYTGEYSLYEWAVRQRIYYFYTGPTVT